jgi:hypothetical protein
MGNSVHTHVFNSVHGTWASTCRRFRHAPLVQGQQQLLLLLPLMVPLRIL